MSNLKRLLDLAKEPSSEKRRELLRDITDIFMDAPAAYSDRESEEFGAIIGTVAHEMEMAVRVNLAAKLASVAEAPRNLILQLANDEIEVAKPVLVRSPVLKDQDLVALAKVKSQDHLAAIAVRPQLSVAVSDALVARGDDTVLENLALNKGAELSRESMETLVQRAELNERLRRPVVTRTDLPPDLLNDMFHVVSSELKRFIMERMDGVDPTLVDLAIRQTERRMKMQVAAPDPEVTKAEAELDKLAKTGGLNEALLVNLSKQKRPVLLACALARVSRIDVKTARKVLADKAPEGLAIVCKANRFDRSTFSTLVLANANGTRSLSETYSLIALYDQVPFDAAQRVIRFWQVRRGSESASAAA
jgi:uncharacterized protein (DUF2336 family)